jgi:acyl-CoA synthetase (NDP forming)
MRLLADTKPARSRRPPLSRKLFLPGEMPAEFFFLLRKAFERRRPANMYEADTVVASVRSGWIFLRHSRALAAYQTKLRRRKPDPALWTDVQTQKLALLTENAVRAKRAYRRILKKVRQIPQAGEHEQQLVQHLLEIHTYLLDFEGFPYDFGNVA